MAFIDNLALCLFLISFSAILLAYMTLCTFYRYKKNLKDPYESVESGVLPLSVLGCFALIIGIVGEFTWPLPGPYNILFFDPLSLLGIILICLALTVKYKRKTKYVGMLSLLSGAVVAYYGISGYGLGLTSSPIVLLLMYLSFGASGIFAYPVTVMFDALPGGNPTSRICKVTLALFCLFLLLAALSSGATGILAIPAHLANPP